jgi:hypothetical protein
MLDIPMAQVRLQRAGIVALVGQGEPTSMPQHVRVSLEAQLSSHTRALYKPSKPRCSEG